MLRMLAGCNGTVVTTGAIIRDVGVIIVCWRPGDRRMAIIAIVAAGDVRRMFASRRIAVMAGTTATKNLGVVDCYRRYPDGDVMAVLANVCG